MKIRTLLCFCVIVLMAVVVSAVAEIDLSPLLESEYADLYVFELDEEIPSYAYISSSSLGQSDVSFQHPDEVEGRTSFIYSDILVMRYPEPDAHAAWRVWIMYMGKTAPHFDSLTIRFQEEDYTFTGLYSDEFVIYGDDYVQESPCIVFGSGNAEFWDMFLLWYLNEDLENVENTSLPMILHGSSGDIETEIHGGSLLDMGRMAEAMLSIGGETGIMARRGTAMKRGPVSLSPGVSADDPAESAEGKSGICIGQNVNLRATPEKRGRRLGMIDRGDPLTVLEDYGEWCLVRCAAGEGFIKTQYIRLNPQ